MSGRWALYGLSISSDRELLGLRPTRDEPDIEVTSSGGDRWFREGRAATDHVRRWFAWARLEDGWDYLRYAEAFEFCVSPDGRRVIGREGEGIDPETYVVYLLNNALSFALLNMGREPVHATVIAVGETGVALCGPPGAGKSTMAAELLERGGRLVTDDLLVVRWDEAGRPFAQLGAPRIKLLSNTADRLFPRLAAGVPVHRHTSKQIVPLPDGLSANVEAPLGLFVVLRPHRPGKVVARGLTERRLLLDLIASTFNEVVDLPDRLAGSFIEDARMAQAVPGISVSLPRRWAALEQACDLIERRILGPDVLSRPGRLSLPQTAGAFARVIRPSRHLPR